MDKNAEFKDAVVVITGAAGIFGRWIAEHFAREGAKLCLSDVRPDEQRPTRRRRRGCAAMTETPRPDSTSPN